MISYRWWCSSLEGKNTFKGSVALQGTTQDHWMHAVPKRANNLGPRINLTFRQIVNPERSRGACISSVELQHICAGSMLGQ